jgi:predicted ATPase
MSNDSLQLELSELVVETLRMRRQATVDELRVAIRPVMPRGLAELTDWYMADQVQSAVVAGMRNGIPVWTLGEFVSDARLGQAIVDSISHEVHSPTAPSDDCPTTAVRSFGFRRLRSCVETRMTLADGGLTVLVGPNGAGKTTILTGIMYLGLSTLGRPRAVFAGKRRLDRQRTAGHTDEVELTALFAGGDALAAVGSDRVQVEYRPEKSRDFATLVSGSGACPSPIFRALWPAVFLRLRAEALAAPSEITDGEPQLGFDGYGLASVLAHLANTAPDRLDAVIAEVRKLVPDVRRTRQRTRRFEPGPVGTSESTPTTPVMQYQFDVEIDGFGWVPAELLSEGTLYALGLHVLLQQPNPPRILLMDDIDRALHPRAQRTLIGQLKAIAATGGTTLVVSTHSPYVLDEVAPECVRVVRGGPGGTKVQALTAHEEWSQWADQMTPGEFWAYVGEDWLESRG